MGKPAGRPRQKKKQFCPANVGSTRNVLLVGIVKNNTHLEKEKPDGKAEKQKRPDTLVFLDGLVGANRGRNC